MVYRIFQFFNEFDLLEVKLATEYDFVDKFIIIESNMTHSGNPKDYTLSLNKERYAKWLDKVEIVQLDMNKIHDMWARESFQRNYSKIYLKGRVKDTDTVIVSDCDEIANEYVIKTGVEYINGGSHLVKVDQPIYIYKFNYYHGVASSLRICSGKLFNDTTPTDILFIREDKLINGGWHFSFLYEKDEEILLKFKSFAHASEKTWLNDPKEAVRHLLAEIKVSYVKLDDTFPKYLIDNKDKFSKYIANE